jgi:hypothetical protein
VKVADEVKDAADKMKLPWSTYELVSKYVVAGIAVTAAADDDGDDDDEITGVTYTSSLGAEFRVYVNT